MEPIPFSFRQIEYLLAVADSGSTSAAARQLNVSQPSISLTVSRIEAHFGAPLFLRLAGQGMQPTSFGRRKVEELRLLLRQARQTLSAEDADATPFQLTLGVFSTLGPLHAPGLVRAFTERHPGARVTLVEDDLSGLLQDLHRGRIDLALVYDVGLPSEIELVHLRDVQPHALVPADHRLSGRDAVSLSELAKDPLVLINLPHSRGYFLSLFQTQGLSPRIGQETSSIEMLRSLVANGLGVGLLATDLPHNLAYDGRRLHRLALTDLLPPSRIALAQTTNWPPSPAAEAFIELSREILGGTGSHSLLTDSGRPAQLNDEEFATLEKVRDKTPARPVSFD
ncbi:LysR family transcriptional regulator [Fodinicurvata sediminis]|uniref:LysR family transcriptional regulator n=1 Tax=Fodinicurvata sediminis TaxID=1121832 RepID=UPI0003B64111|nr:LysR family transcriptional regulator [Fodinicurvata sediminis]